MSIISLLVPMSLMLGLGFAFFFVKAVRSGLFDDCETPAYRILDDGDIVAPATVVGSVEQNKLELEVQLKVKQLKTKEVQTT